MLKSVIFLRIYLSVTVLLFGVDVVAQPWLQGFAYRKKITFNKSKAEGPVVNGPAPASDLDLSNFPVLLILEDPDLRYIKDRFDKKITNPKGLDVSFASFASPSVPLKFQIENYNAEKGLLVCWVQVPSLSVKNSSSPATSIYLYYGSSILYDPLGTSAKMIWEDSYHYVDHLDMNVPGKIGQGWRLNGTTDRMFVRSADPAEITLSAWIRLDKAEREQVIISTDTLKNGGYQFKVGPTGKLVLEGFGSGEVKWTVNGLKTLSADTWYYVNAVFQNGKTTFYVNGLIDASRSSSTILLRKSGQFSIGASKQNDCYFEGILDELRLGKTAKSQNWLKTAYENQNDPPAFYSIGSEERNPDIKPSFFVFLGQKNTLWSEPFNWDTGSVPPGNANIKIAAGKVARLNIPAVVNRLLLETGAVLGIDQGLNIVQDSRLEPNALISDAVKTEVRFGGNVVNNGSINLNVADSKLVFFGTGPELNFTGNGAAIVGELEVGMADPGSTVLLGSSLKVNVSVNLVKGILKANGQLTLLASKNRSACLRPVLNSAETSVTGLVQVQNFIDGAFPSPSTGRGWRLLCSPVVSSSIGERSRFSLGAIKNSVFVTGSGGLLNGFDASPNNGATIYTHDQALPGTLTQKYVPISNMSVNLALGQGFFLFSRGSRLIQNAYENEILNPAFNPDPYLITYTGELFVGDLRKQLLNRDLGNEGDGFNLAGNPYAAPIRWGSLIKENLGPYIWLFDPLNNAYRVSDDPDEVIPAGAGFFVKVNSGFKYGYLGFSENCKVKL